LRTQGGKKDTKNDISFFLYPIWALGITQNSLMSRAMISPVGNMALITGIAPLGLDRAKSLSRDSPLDWGLPAELARL
jgi:hypothetical protein